MTSQVSTNKAAFDTHQQLVLPDTLGNQSGDLAFTVTLADVPSIAASTSDRTDTSTQDQDQRNLTTLEQLVNDLSGYHQRQRTALASSMAEALVDNTLAPMAQHLDLIKSAVPQVAQIFKTMESYTPTAETFHRANELIASIKEQLEKFSAEAAKFNGSPASNAAMKAEKLCETLTELAQSAAIDPEKQQTAPLENPFEPLIAGIGPVVASEAFASILTPEPISNEAFNAAVAQGRLEKLGQKFPAAVAQSRDNPIDIEAKLKTLDNKSVLDYLTERHATLVETITSTNRDLSDSSAQLAADAQAVDALDTEIQVIHEHYGVVAQQIDNGKAGILHLEAIQDSPPAVPEPSTASVTNTKSRQLIARAKDSVSKLYTRFRKTGAPETSTEQPVSAPPASSSEELNNLKSALVRDEKRIEELAAKFGAKHDLLAEKYTALVRLESSIELLKATLLGAREQLQAALLETCKNLSFKAPKVTTDPVTEALLDISVPKTPKTIPSLSSITESLHDLGATIDGNGATSFTDPTTGQTLKIASCSAHGLNATLTVIARDGSVIASDLIWNHHLTEVVEHFQKTGEAPVQSREIAEWTVSDQALATKEASAPVDSKERADLFLSPRAKRVVAYLQSKLELAGLTVTGYGNKLDAENQSQTITAVLNKNDYTWSLYGALEAANVSAVQVITRIKDLFTQKPAENSLLESEVAPEAITTADTGESLASSPAATAVQAEGLLVSEPTQLVQNGTQQTQKPSIVAEKDELIAKAVDAWKEAKAVVPWNFKLSDTARIAVERNAEGTYVTTLHDLGTADQPRTNKRTDNNVEQSLRIMVGRHLQDR